MRVRKKEFLVTGVFLYLLFGTAVVFTICSGTLKSSKRKTIVLCVQHTGKYQLTVTQNGHGRVIEKYSHFERGYHYTGGLWDFSVDTRKLTENEGSLYCSLRDEEGNIITYESTKEPYGEIHLNVIL
jgi:hypothetical protein